MWGLGVRRFRGVGDGADVIIDDGSDEVAIDLRSAGAEPVGVAPDGGGGVAAVPVRPMRFALHRLLVSPGRDVPLLYGRVAGVVKRVLDLVGSLVLLVVFSPVLLVVAVGVVTTSRGPVIFRQHRVGRHGDTFRMLKFRSMVADADARAEQMAELVREGRLVAVDAPKFKSADDPRVTAVGRVLRRTSLDELPQLLNVFMGHMSLVGPRPIEGVEADTLPAEVAQRRQSVRPGITCLWQVTRYDDMPFGDRIELDLLYVNGRSLLLDLVLLAVTPIAIVTGEGAH